MSTLTRLIDLLEPLTGDAAFDNGRATSDWPSPGPDADEIEHAREEAWAQGYAQGQEAARRAFEAEARAGLNTQYQEDLAAAVRRILAEIATARRTLWENQEAEMLELALDIARQVVKTELQQNPEVVRHVVENAIRRASSGDSIRLRVSVTDVDKIRHAHGDLTALLGGIRHIEIIEDRRIGPGGCIVETTTGTIDATIESQLAQVARALGLDQSA